jgi:hypothetical protein
MGKTKYYLTITATVLMAAMTIAASASASDPQRERAVKIVTQIQRADYEGDRVTLGRLPGELLPFVENKELASRARYWRGFALWRRAINGFNDKVDSQELKEDLQRAAEEFEVASQKEPGFVDAKIGSLSCATLLAFSVNEKDKDRIREWMTKGQELRKEIEASEPDNPRYLWVMGPNVWYSPPERGGGEAKAMEMYRKGLQEIRQHKVTVNDALDPSWGEPELLMNLGWSNLHKSSPDLGAAERDARSALVLVPYWHYVRDILIPQIEEAKAKPHAASL